MSAAASGKLLVGLMDDLLGDLKAVLLVEMLVGMMGYSEVVLKVETTVVVKVLMKVA